VTKKIIYEYRSPWARLIGKAIFWTLVVVIFIDLLPFLLVAVAFGLVALLLYAIYVGVQSAHRR